MTNRSGKFIKAYTRDFSIIMEEAWYYGLSVGLWIKLGLKNKEQEGWPNFFRFNKGIIEVWEDRGFISQIMDAIHLKSSDLKFFDKLLRDYGKLTKELKNSRLSNNVYIEKLFEAIAIFPIIWYGILDSRIPAGLKDKFVYIRDRDTVFDSNDKIVRERILKKYKNLKGFETTLLRDEFLNNPPEISILKKRLNNFVLVPGKYAEITKLELFVKKYRITLDVASKPKNNILKGFVANSGRATGTVTVIRMKSDVNKMKRGNILISPMTTPDVFSALRKASAVVTDEGGALCHAAILCREYNIPCIIGTVVASEMFKDGDMVEVDANKGILRLL